MAELLVSFAVATLAAPSVLRVLRHRGVLDVPNHRSSHVMPGARHGGIACVASVLAGLIFASAQNHEVPWLAVTGSVLLALVGLADDQGTVGAARLGAHIAMGALVGASVGGGWWGLVVDDQIGGFRIRLGIAELTNPVIAP